EPRILRARRRSERFVVGERKPSSRTAWRTVNRRLQVPDERHGEQHEQRTPQRIILPELQRDATDEARTRHENPKRGAERHEGARFGDTSGVPPDLPSLAKTEKRKADEEDARAARVGSAFFCGDVLGLGRGWRRSEPRVVDVAERARI